MMYGNHYKIDNNIPVPSAGGAGKGRGTNATTNTVAMLRVGESFFIPKLSKQCRPSATAKQVSSAVGYVRKKHPERRYAVRTVTENRQQGARCWRIA